MRLGRKMRRKLYYRVPEAGRMPPLKLSRTESYRWAEAGDIPTERNGRFLDVPRQLWDAEIKRRLDQMRDAELQSRRVKPEPVRRVVTRKSENSEFA